MADNIEKFNTIVGLVFSQLYSSFPVALELDEGEIVRGMGFEPRFKTLAGFDRQFLDGWPTFPDGTLSFPIYYSAIDWLQEEGFIRKTDGANWVLTARALTALNAQPGVLSEPLGRQLTSAAKGAASDAGRAVITEVVGQVIAGVAKGFMGG